MRHIARIIDELVFLCLIEVIRPDRVLNDWGKLVDDVHAITCNSTRSFMFQLLNEYPNRAIE